MVRPSQPPDRTTRVLAVLVGWGLMATAPTVLADDLAYGAYLAAECATCHRLDGSEEAAIPGIAGLEPEAFTEALAAYRTGARPHPIMANVARSLDEAQVRALACYYASLRTGQ